MKQYVQFDPWNVIEEGFSIENKRFYESIMSIGNGYMGIRGNFEEQYTGDSLKGTYISGIYYPDKTRVGWWKNGYPEYFARVLNSTNFIGINVIIDGENLDLANVKFKNFKRTLNMKQGILVRSFILIDSKNRELLVEIKRFLSIVKKEVAAISYSITPLNHNANITFIPYLDGNVYNEDSNYDEKFWLQVNKVVQNNLCYITMKTKKLDFQVTAAMKYGIHTNNMSVDLETELIDHNDYIGNKITLAALRGQPTTLYKYISVTNNRYVKDDRLVDSALTILEEAYCKGFEYLFLEHSQAWENRWKGSDIIIEGDIAAQQGIRFGIFQLYQTYTGEDLRLNIGPKGLTGEKYGGSTYWDTEAFCLPFYLGTCNQNIAKNLLLYRYNHLEKAKENAKKLGLFGALYPMVTINGEECHNEWEITFEEIHRNAAISYAIFNYVRYTGDYEYLANYGFDVLIEISRFWESRVNYNPCKDKYMILGVTGPNEYENNINNNWYTNKMAVWNLKYTLEVDKILKERYPERYKELKLRLNISDEENKKWSDIIEKMYYPYVHSLDIFEQQDGYMDKELLVVQDIPKEDLPLNQHWSWDRILRSCFIKQADVLQGLFFLSDEFDFKTKKRNFDFYEPKTVHESSLSSCIHSIIASELGYKEKAYELYLRTSRLDLDNYNNDTADGLHITSMAGTWMSIVYGFGGTKIRDEILCFNPIVPEPWSKYSFKLLFRGRRLKVTVNRDNTAIELENGDALTVMIWGKGYVLSRNKKIEIN